MSDKNKILIDSDISISTTMPSKFYLKNKYFKFFLNKVFKQSWQLITDKESLSSNLYPFVFLKKSINEPMLISYNDKDLICLSNVCTHRGNILCDKLTKAKNIKCNYHGRSFNLEGKIKTAPGFKGVKNFPSSYDNLKKYKVKEWNDFIFCSIQGKINIDEVLDDISIRLKEYPFKKLLYNKNDSKEYIIDAHWALYCENYLEGFHVPFIHKGLKKDIDLDTYKTKLLNNGVLQFVEGATTKTKKNYAYYYWIFPNLMLNFYEWGLSINIIEPINKEKTKIKFLSYPIKGKAQPKNSNSSIKKIELEDQAVVVNVQKGIKSQAYKKGRYSVKHESGVHYFHQLLSRYLN